MTTEANALAGALDPASSSDQTKNDQPLAETAPSTQDQPEVKEGAEPTAAKADEAPADGKQPSRAAERIKELVRERNDAEIRAYAAEAKLRSLKRPIPVKDNMTETERAVREVREAERAEELEATSATAEEAKQEARLARLNLFTEKVGDQAIVDAFCKLPRVSAELADLVAESDHAKALAIRLNANPSEARRLSSLPPHRLGAELARMEASLASQPAVRRVSQAPEPSTTLKGGSSPAAFDPHKASAEDMAKVLRSRGVIR